MSATSVNLCFEKARTLALAVMLVISAAFLCGPFPACADEKQIQAPLSDTAQTPEKSELIQFPGTSWSINPPPGFTLTEKPTPVLRNNNGAGIMLVQTQRQPFKISEFGIVGTIDSAGTQNESRLEAVEQITANGRPAAIIKLQMTKQPSVIHGILVEGETSNVTAYFVIPNAAADIDGTAIRAALLSIIETPRNQEQRLEDLPFAMQDLADMRVSYIINNIVILTEGPGDDMDKDTKQPFAIVSLVPMGFEETFDPARDIAKMAEQLRRDYPVTTIVSTEVVETPQGAAAAIGYTRLIKKTGYTVGGMAWIHRSGNWLVFVIAQHSLLRPEQAERIARIRDGILPR